jgi:hypothetical protein
MATVRVDIEGNSSGLTKELKKADASVMDFGRGLSSIAGKLGIAFSVGAIVNFTRHTIAAADAVVTYAKGIGESVQATLALSKAGIESGVAQEKTLGWLQKIKDAQETIVKSGGKSPLAAQLESINISVAEFVNMSPTEAFNALTEAAIKTGKGVSVLTDILGKMSASDAMDMKSIIDAAGGWDVYKAGVERAAEATRKLADQQDRIDKLKASVSEAATTWLGDLISLAAKNNETMGLGENNAAGFLPAFFQNLDPYSRAYAQNGLGVNTPNLNGTAGAGTGATGSGAEESPAALMARIATEADEAARAKLYDAWKNRNTMDETIAGYGDVKTMKSMREGTRIGIEGDRSWMSPQKLAEMIAFEKALTAEIEKREKVESDIADKRQKMIDAAAEQRETVRINTNKAIEGITVGVPRLNDMESVGAIMGGTGRAADSMQQRLDKIADINLKATESLKSIDETLKGS